MKRLLLSFIIISSLWFSSSAQCLKPAVDTVSGAVIQAGGLAPYASTITWTHTVSASKGTNRLLVVEVACDTLPDSVTYAGIKLMALYSATDTNYSAQMWYLTNPPTGIDTVNVYFRVGTGTFFSHKSAEAISLYNVDPTVPFGTPVSSIDTVCPTSLVASSDTNAIILDMIVKDYFRPVTPDPSQTALYTVAYANGNAVGGSVKNGGDSVSFSWHWIFCSAYPWAALAVPVEPACITSAENLSKSESTYSVYPNPSYQGQVYLSCGTKDGKLKNIFIYNTFGKIVYQILKTDKSDFDIDLAQAAKGIYLVKVVIEGNISFNKIVLM